LLKKLKERKHFHLDVNDFDREKAEIFSLGMTALEMALLSSVQDCYDMVKLRINEINLINKIR